MTTLLEPPTAPAAPPELVTPAIPAALIYEVWDGKPIYYRGYREVLAGLKTPEEIMSCSDLQGVLVSLLNIMLGNQLDRKKYLLATNEVGLHIVTNSNLANDLVIYDKASIGKLKGKFFDVPPRVVIEVDIKADVSEFAAGGTDYLAQKSQKMLDFGTERIIWILTATGKVFVADRHQPRWYVTDWSEDVPVLDDCVLNVKKLLDDEEISY